MSGFGDSDRRCPSGRMDEFGTLIERKCMRRRPSLALDIPARKKDVRREKPLVGSQSSAGRAAVDCVPSKAALPASALHVRDEPRDGSLPRQVSHGRDEPTCEIQESQQNGSSFRG